MLELKIGSKRFREAVVDVQRRNCGDRQQRLDGGMVKSVNQVNAKVHLCTFTHGPEKLTLMEGILRILTMSRAVDLK